jgi:hypothetical protein
MYRHFLLVEYKFLKRAAHKKLEPAAMENMVLLMCILASYLYFTKSI